MLMLKYLSENVDIVSEVSCFEKKIGFNLPEQYRTFLLRYNGGDTPETTFRCNRKSSDVRAFYGVGNARYNFNEIPFLKDFLDDNYLPIAEDSYGNYIVIGLADDLMGKIYFCNHEQQMKTKLLTENFADFVKACKSKQFDDEEPLTVEEHERLMIEAGKGDMINDFFRKVWQETYDVFHNRHQEKVVID